MDPKNTHCKWCSGYRCKNSKNRRPDLAFFRFPLDEELCKQWVTNSRRKDLLTKPVLDLHRSNVLCAAHFEPCCFRKTKRKLLTKDAIPTVFDFSNPTRLLTSIVQLHQPPESESESEWHSSPVATSSHQSEAESSVSKAESSVSKAESSVSKAESSVSKAESSVSKAESSVSVSVSPIQTTSSTSSSPPAVRAINTTSASTTTTNITTTTTRATTSTTTSATTTAYYAVPTVVLDVPKPPRVLSSPRQPPKGRLQYLATSCPEDSSPPIQTSTLEPSPPDMTNTTSATTTTTFTTIIPTTITTTTTTDAVPIVLDVSNPSRMSTSSRQSSTLSHPRVYSSPTTQTTSNSSQLDDTCISSSTDTLKRKTPLIIKMRWKKTPRNNIVE